MSRGIKPNKLRDIEAHFQRSINLTHDAGDKAYIAGYIPTPGGAKALARILRSTDADKTTKSLERAHVVHAAYGSGKSLLAIVLAAIVEDARSQTVDIVKHRLQGTYPTEASELERFEQRGQRFLPVFLSGDEGSLSLALPRALLRALQARGLKDLQPRTQFQAARNTIFLWEESYVEVYHRFSEKLSEQGLNISSFVETLDQMDREALMKFVEIYPSLTAGAMFDPDAANTLYSTQSLSEIFQRTVEALREAGYVGIFVIWDEFGRFLEARVGEAFGPEAAALQDFAEFCNKSGPDQVHFVLTTHKVLSGYADALPLSYQQEWARIAERFVAHNLASDPQIVYRLIADAFATLDQTAWAAFLDQNRAVFQNFTAKSLELTLFEDVDAVRLRQQIIEKTWPLHPLSLYALPRLSNQVAQNERTLFTFLASDDPYTLGQYLAQPRQGWETIGPHLLWDYFAEAIRTDAGPGGTHSIWSGVMYALSKVSLDDDQASMQAIIKALGILLILGEANVQTQGLFGQILPNEDLIAWGLHMTIETVKTCLETLAKRRAVVFRRSEGYWIFTRGSDIDLEAEIASVVEQLDLSPSQMRQILEREVKPSFYLPRGYNQTHAMIRFFWGLYRWPREILGTTSETFLQQLGSGSYADGAIVYILATNAAECEEVQTTITHLEAGRIVYVVPKRPLLIKESLQELFALYALKNNPNFMDQDERLSREVEFFIEDALYRLKRALRPILATNNSGATWWYHKGSAWGEAPIYSAGDVSRLLSDLCERWFDQTPRLNNELLNQQAPSKQQTQAAKRVIDALFSYPDGKFPDRLGLSGFGPDFLIFRTLLVVPELLTTVSDDQDGDAIMWQLNLPPQDPLLKRLHHQVNQFLESSLESEQGLDLLLNLLQKPPYGLRKGVLPVLLAVFFHPHLHVLTLRQNKRIILPINGSVLVDLCQHPDRFTIEIGLWDKAREILWDILQDQFQSFVGVHERTQQPLSYLSLALLRWLQTQPRFCRDTDQISEKARHFRVLIRQAQRMPARVLLYDLLDLLAPEDIDAGNEADYVEYNVFAEALQTQLHRLMDEITTAYQSLLYQLDTFVEQNFPLDQPIPQSDSQTILMTWLKQVEAEAEQSLITLRFRDSLVERLVQTILSEKNDGRFWDRLSHSMLGLYLHDWNDHSIDSFGKTLLDAKKRLKYEVFELSQNDDVVELNVLMPNTEEQHYRFRPTGLSEHGQRIFQNFVSTLEIAGRPLSSDEKRQVVLALLNYVMDTAKSDD